MLLFALIPLASAALLLPPMAYNPLPYLVIRPGAFGRTVRVSLSEHTVYGGGSCGSDYGRREPDNKRTRDSPAYCTDAARK